ncbi:sensor histidine kinase [Panacibacter ginsenosidivorans]|uniref:histidine kinase n=1 Tax=Panacibacter ginsenosidivorans TaxID=1813871 RepID=A0A5B8VE40_9BACT|nr:sensor histidine kinase [Panacibacter ginsenosidivorans]QEC69305.1 sensor histidine kinase [Panacibacter ginsenosidivorans]
MYPEERRIIYAVLIAVIVLAALITFFVVSVIRYNRKRMSVQQEKTMTDILSLEKERARFAADLHDDLGGTLSAIKLKLQRLPMPDNDGAVLLTEVEQHIDDCMQKLREVAFSMMPRQLQRKGINEAIQEMIVRMNHDDSIKINLCSEALSLDKEKEIHIFRITQEILNNIWKHANATEITLELLDQDKKIVLHIADNGIGFDKNWVFKNSNGLGLHNIMARVEILGARIFLQSGKNIKGTDYFIEIPNNHEYNANHKNIDS